MDVIESALRQLGAEFKGAPFAFATEHGIHSRFVSLVFQELGADYLVSVGDYFKVSRAQNEYQTPNALDRSQRQHWDFVLLSDQQAFDPKTTTIEQLQVDAVVEFGLNAPDESVKVSGEQWKTSHLLDDLDRLYIGRNELNKAKRPALFAFDMIRVLKWGQVTRWRAVGEESGFAKPFLSLQHGSSRSDLVKILYESQKKAILLLPEDIEVRLDEVSVLLAISVEGQSGRLLQLDRGSLMFREI